MRARLSDIAQQAEVSEATVSRVLNDRPGVAPETRQAVLTALDVLGYERPARLRKRSAGLVGLVVPELDNPIFPAFAQVIESTLAQSGFTPVLCTQTAGGVTEDEYVEMLLDRQVSGIVFVSGLHADTAANHDRYRALLARPLPVVMINGYVPGIGAPFVSCDDREAAELAVAHLVALGHRRIGLITGPDRFVPVQRKVAGWRSAMTRLAGVAEADLGPLAELSLFGVEGGEAAAGRLLDRGVTGVVCGSDLMALGAIRAARQRGLERARRPLRGRLRRLAADGLHRPAADHHAAAGHRDGGRRRPGPGRRDQRARRPALGVPVPPGAGGARLHRSRLRRSARLSYARSA